MLELDTGLLGQGTEKIRRIEGHFNVLVTESLEHIDIPFKSTEGWVRPAPGLEVKVVKAQSSESRYQYSIETRREGDAFRGLLSPGVDLPKRLLVDRQFIGRNGKLARPRHRSIRMPAYGGGSGSGSGSSLSLIEKIRFVVAVNPSHHKIPFVLEDIPLPSPDAAEATRAASRTRSRAQSVPYTPTGPLGKTIHRNTTCIWERALRT
jgi:hypothetical protein